MTVPQRVWFERRFALGLPVDHVPELIERLRGTPARLEERLTGLDASSLRSREGDGWSVHAHAGHLVDLEPLWLGRVEDIERGDEVMREADLENRATWEADHDDRPVTDTLATFRSERAKLVGRLEALNEDGLRATALHPRLRQPMSVVDLAFFVAEHDDHHLATITRLLGD